MILFVHDRGKRTAKHLSNTTLGAERTSDPSTFITPRESRGEDVYVCIYTKRRTHAARAFLLPAHSFKGGDGVLSARVPGSAAE